MNNTCWLLQKKDGELLGYFQCMLYLSHQSLVGMDFRDLLCKLWKHLCITCITTCSLLWRLLDSVNYPVYLLYSFFTPQQADKYCCRASVRPSMCSCLGSQHMLSNSDVTLRISDLSSLYITVRWQMHAYFCVGIILYGSLLLKLSKNLPVIMVVFQRRERNALNIRK